jgi:hypothetical protein
MVICCSSVETTPQITHFNHMKPAIYAAHFLKCYIINFYAKQFFADLLLRVPVRTLYFINYNYLSVLCRFVIACACT